MRLKHHTSYSDGLALIVVLWLLSVLSLLAATLATLSISSRREAFGTDEVERLELIADGAIRLAVLNVIAAPRTRASTLSLNRQLSIFDTHVSVTIELESGRIDLNTAGDDLLFAFFSANGQTEAQARILAARIADWKDPDDAPRPEGAELQQYLSAGKSYGPRNASFETVEELRQVLGAEALKSDVFESLTVYTHSMMPAEEVAPAPVKAALAWADAHELGGHPWHRETSGQSPILGTGDLIGQIIRIHACAHSLSARACREAVVRPVGQSDEPFQVFLWRSHPWE